MTDLSDFFGAISSAEIVELKTELANLTTTFTGQETKYPPIDTELPNAAFVAKIGGLLSRATYPVLWQWVSENTTTVTDVVWTAIQISSPTAKVDVYSIGNGTTTFRVPTVGTDEESEFIYSGNNTSDVPAVVTPEWLAQQAVNTSAIATNTTNLAQGNDWVFIGQPGAPVYESSFYADNISTGIKYRFIDDRTIHVIGRAQHVAVTSSNLFRFHPDIASRINTDGSFSPGLTSGIGGVTYTQTTTNGILYVQTSYTNQQWIMVNHTIVLDI